ncbi:hypothetical protein AM506_02540 [Rossellomorea vietnamensis]|uniref:Uncharacterized protein n=1 Tax=Rossellomorea vietnamensis TaxID=218284 RepID=A0A0N8GHK1_9BACI|nr:hypothetical protein AM506_02540 [Rossellomorea vietnamensis]
MDHLAYDLEGLAAVARQLRPRRAKPEEAQLTPRGKRAPAAEISQHSLLLRWKFSRQTVEEHTFHILVFITIMLSAQHIIRRGQQ